MHDINLKLYQGEKVLIIGPSGSGKSTLTACINGLIPHAYAGDFSGSLKIKGRDVLADKLPIFERSKSIGTVLQDTDGQFIGLSVAEDIAFSLENDQIPLDQMHQRVLASSKLVKMDDFLASEPHALSGGQKQSVSLAGVMIDAVDILLFDEPLANLDPAAGKEAIELIDWISKEKQTTTVIVEHRLEDVLYRHVDRIILINDGRILADVSADEMLSSSLLAENGIREPLYLAALKYAGLTLTPDLKPDNLAKMSLSEAAQKQLQDWFKQAKPQAKPAAAENLLTVKNLNFAYENGKNVLNDVNFQIAAGEFLAIVGQNGAGKSTLSKLICGFEKLTSGQILFKNQDLADLTIAQRAEHIGYVMQNPNQMISKAQIFDEVALGLRARGLAEAEIREKVEATLKICGLYEFRNWPVSALSFGQKKRVSIASILVLEPELLILDEPTAGQDYRHYTEIMSFLEQLNQRGITIVIITHDMHLMLEYARRVLVFGQHRLLADLAPEQVFVNSNLLQEASLKETSLYDLAKRCGIADGAGFIRHFIEFERQLRQQNAVTADRNSVTADESQKRSDKLENTAEEVKNG